MSVSIEATHRPFHVEELLNPGMPEKFVEIIEGELVVISPAGWEHNRVGYKFQRLFEEFCASRPELKFGFDNDGFLLQRNPDVMFCPDASIFRGKPEPGRPWFNFAPDIAVEVLSPGNSSAEIAYKRSKYFASGTEQVWFANPSTRTLEIYLRDGRRIIAQGDESLTGEGTAQGMTINLTAIFAGQNP